MVDSCSGGCCRLSVELFELYGWGLPRLQLTLGSTPIGWSLVVTGIALQRKRDKQAATAPPPHEDLAEAA